MSALSEALPLALSAAVYPPALVVLLLFMSSADARGLVLAYFGGAGLLTIAAGLIALEVLSATGLTVRDSPSASGWVYVVAGVLLLGLAVWAWRRRAAGTTSAGASAEEDRGGRVAEWSRRALTSRRWAFALGLAMFLPSPLYLLAVKDIADSGDSTTSQALAVLICATGVMLFVEVPLAAMYLRPARRRVRPRTRPSLAGAQRLDRRRDARSDRSDLRHRSRAWTSLPSRRCCASPPSSSPSAWPTRSIPARSARPSTWPPAAIALRA